jgi:hypothetical protein
MKERTEGKEGGEKGKRYDIKVTDEEEFGFTDFQTW